MADIYERAIALHEELRGKIATQLKTDLNSKEDMALVYSPGVAEPCRRIAKNKADIYKYTGKGNTIAVISNGTAVLGLGDIGPEAALPVMEGKCCLFKRFGDVNAVPLVVDITDVDEFVEWVKKVGPAFGGINLEDISAPKCIEIERRLIEEMDIPVFHDDQHGTAIVTTAAVLNSLKLIGKKAEDCTVVMSGVGAAGSSIIRMLNSIGIKNIYGFNSRGVLNEKDAASYTNPLYKELAKITNHDQEDLSFEEAMKKADIFVGVSVKDKVTKEMVKNMKKAPIVFAMANPDPEITYKDAKEAGARVAGTGRSDDPNQVNNVLAFPGLFKGALKVHASKITEEMKLAAAYALAELVPEDKLADDYVIPSSFDEGVADHVAEAVAKKAQEQGVARVME